MAWKEPIVGDLVGWVKTVGRVQSSVTVIAAGCSDCGTGAVLRASVKKDGQVVCSLQDGWIDLRQMWAMCPIVL